MYEIKILSNKDFDKVAKSDPRYRFVDGSNLGFADRLKGIAYVRQTNVHDLNKYLVTHELEELESDSSVHQDAYGIRHKKFFKEFLLPTLFSGMFGGKEAMLSTGINALSGGSKTNFFSNGGSAYSGTASGSVSPSTAQNFANNFSPLTSFVTNPSANLSGSSRVSQPFSGGYSPTITNGGINGEGTLDEYQRARLSGNNVGAIKF